VVDVSDNYLDDDRILSEVLYKMEDLRVLYLQGNPITKNTRFYRKTLTSNIPDLRYLDDKPVFEDERRFAEAWARGGLPEEKEERAKFKKEKDDAHWKNHQAFKDMIKKAKEEKRIADEAKAIVREHKERNGLEVEEVAGPAEEAEEKEEAEEPMEGEKEETTEQAHVEEECPPELEEISPEQLKEEQEKAKQLKAQKEVEEKKWLEEVHKEEAAPAQTDAFIPWDDASSLPEPSEEAVKRKVD